jgi:cob(I)alamin adenosyltransferase
VKIYTRGGDGGETGLFDGARVGKSSARIAATGDVDELNACLGVVRAHLAVIDAHLAAGAEGALADLDAALAGVQSDLFALGALLADPRRDAGRPETDWTAKVPFGDDRAAALEPRIDAWEAELEPLTRFILPAGTHASAALHVARATCRRAERSVVSLLAGGEGHPTAVVYLNRLSDLLFVAARLANSRAGVADEPWEKSRGPDMSGRG